LWFEISWLAFPWLYLFSQAWLAVLNPHFVTYANGFYDTQAAKRVLPVVNAGARTGAIFAGLTMSLLTGLLTSMWITVLWLLVCVAVMILIWASPYLLQERKMQSVRQAIAPETGPVKEYASYLENVREGFRYTAQSKFLQWMAIGMLILMVLLGLLEYRSNEVLLQFFGTPASLANFLALLLAIGNIFVLPILLMGISRLIARIGVGNAKLIFPAGNLLISGALIFVPGLLSASLSYLDRTAFRLGFQAPIDNLLYNAVPLRVKGRARAFVDGLVAPVGLLIGGLLLFLPILSVTWFISLLIGLLAVTYLAGAWYTRRQYGQALVQMLEQEDYSFLLSPDAPDLTVTDPAMLKQLQQQLEQSTSPEFTIFMAQLMAQAGGDSAVPILSREVNDSDDARIRAAILDVLTATGLRGDTLWQLYTDALTDNDGQVRQSAIAGLEQLVGPSNQQFIAQMLSLLHDPNLEVRVRVLLALVRSGEFYQMSPAVDALNQLLVSVDPHCRMYGVRLLGEIGDPHAVRDLLEYLADPADEVRLEAITAVDALSLNGDLPSPVIKKVIPLLQDPIQGVRELAVGVLGRSDTPEVYAELVGALSDSSPQVRAAAADALVQLGKAVIITVEPLLDSSDSQLRKMAAVILCQINEREYGPLITMQVTGNLSAIYQNHHHLATLDVYGKYPGVSVLQAALCDLNKQLVDEIFYLLTAIHDPKTIQTITDSLNSDDIHVRANAVEALESLVSPEMARLIAPLFEPDLPRSQLLALGQSEWGMADRQPGVAIKQIIESDLPWLQAIAVFALGEIGADLEPQEVVGSQPDQPVPEEDDRKKRRRGPANLLDVLDDIGEKVTETTRRRVRRRPADILETLADDKESPVVEPVSSPDTPSNSTPPPLSLPEIEKLLVQASTSPVEHVQISAQLAQQMIAHQYSLDVAPKEDVMFSVIEKIIFLKGVPFFQGMTINQLEVLANVCEEQFFAEDAPIFGQGDPGGVMYVVVSGKVGIEREAKRKGSTVRLATYGAHDYFGEMTVFDRSPRSAAAIALQDTLTLSLRREPLIALTRQYPDLSLELINVLSQRLREANEQISQLTRTRPREIHKLFDKLDQD
jgi:CRP-like cAMP-binding protein/HEAT repeat protein